MTPTKPFAAHLHYHVLGHIDLGRDRASLHRPDRANHDWCTPLRDAYVAGDSQMTVQILPLEGPSPADDEAKDLLERFRGWSDDHRLAGALRRAYESEEERAREQYDRASEGIRTLEAIRHPLEVLRQKLWERLPSDPPELQVFHVPSLAGADGWTHGRALTKDDTRRVAVSLDVDPARALVQIFHEEVHPVTDPAVYASSDGKPNVADIEQTAINVGAAVVAAVEDEFDLPLADAYRCWRARYR